MEFDISYKLAPKETTGLKYQTLFSDKIKKSIINLSSTEIDESMLRLTFQVRSQFVLKSIRTQVNSFSFWSTRTHFSVNSYS